MTVCCANCESVLQSQTGGDTFHLYQGDTDEIVTVSEAVFLIFANDRSVNQNCCEANKLRLCPNCISIIPELYRFFIQFKNQSTGSSCIQHILSDPNWTLHDENCINNPNHDYAASIKEEGGYENENHDEWIVPDVTPAEPDFVIKSDSTAEISTRLRFRKARFATALDQVKRDKLKTPKRCSVKKHITPLKRSLRLAEKSSSHLAASTPSQSVSPAARTSDVTEESTQPFECRQCVPPKDFKRMQSLTIHERAFHPKDEDSQRQFKCPRCFLQLRGERGIRSHMKQEHQEVAKFSCPHCPKTFTKIRSMTEHVKAVHVGYSLKEKETNTCLVCEKVYPSKQRLKLHLQGIHTAGEALQCDICDKIYSAQYRFEMHRKMHFEEREENRPTFSCTLCEKVYATKAGLQSHVDIVHLQKDEFICDICGFKAPSILYLRAHMESHNTELKYSCPTCSNQFKTRRSLSKHKTSHQGLNRLCPYCGKGFKTPDVVRRHIQALHREYPEVESKIKSHPCPICGKEFKLRDYLTQHLRSKAHGGTGRHQNQRTSHSRKAKDKEVMVRNTEEDPTN